MAHHRVLSSQPRPRTDRECKPDCWSTTIRHKSVERSNLTEHNNLCSFTSRVEKRIRVRLNLCFGQSPLDLSLALLKAGYNAPRKTVSKTRNENVLVIIRHLFVADYHKIPEAKVEVFLHFQPSFEYFIELLTR